MSLFLFCQVIEDYPDQQPDLVARLLLNHGAQPASTRVSTCCIQTSLMLQFNIGRSHPRLTNICRIFIINPYFLCLCVSQMLKLCLLSPDTLEVMLNCYEVVPACDEWLEPEELQKVSLNAHKHYFIALEKCEKQET